MDHPKKMNPIDFCGNQSAKFQDSGNKERHSNLSPRQSWSAGDEKIWMAPENNILQRPSDDSHYSFSSGALSYATTTSSQSRSSLKPENKLEKPKPALL
jgi:hypothetical protein